MKTSRLFVPIISFLTAAVTVGCTGVALLDPKGPIGEAERYVILVALGLMAIVVVPVFFMAVWFPAKYRESNSSSRYEPRWNHSLVIETLMWGFPIAIVLILGFLAWTRTHALDPYRPIASVNKPINVDVVCLDWKWLFIYPDQGVAVVNEMVFPVDVPVAFRITSASVMASFFIPQLGSQIYAMAGMRTRLHLLANEVGSYSGHNQQFTGQGYSDMHFETHVVSQEEFQAWIQKVRQSSDKLDMDRYEAVAKPSEGFFPITYFSSVRPALFDYVVTQFNPHMQRGASKAME